MPVTPKTVLTDPKFQAMTPEQKQQVLLRIDPNFAKLSPEQQQAVVGYQAASAPAAAPEPRSSPSVGDYLYEGAAGLGRAGKSILWDLPKAILPGLSPAGTGTINNPLGIVGDLGKQLVAMLNAGASSAESGEGRAGQTLSMMENAPMIGEAVKRVEKAGPGYFNLSPEAIGAATEGAGYVLAPEAAKGIAKGTAVGLQRLAGAGKEPVLLKAMARDEAVAKAQAAHADRVAEVEAQEKAAAAQSKYGDQLRQNLQQTYERVKGKLDSRWGQMRSTPTRSGGGLSILKDEVANAKDLRDGMEIAERKFLQGSPESLRQFRDLTGWMERKPEGVVGGEAGGIKPGLTPPTWDELRTHYSNMGDAMYGRDIPSNVFRAMDYVRNDVIGKQLSDMATKAGVGDQYQALLKDHSQFENDWHNTKSVTRGGGSPLAVARKAPNAATLIPQVTGKTGDLLIKRLSKYQDAGASPATAEAIRKGGTINVPSRPIPPKPPVPLDPVAIRRQRILEYTSRPKSVYDFVPPRLFTEPLLSTEAIREWVAKMPRKEYPVPPKE